MTALPHHTAVDAQHAPHDAAHIRRVEARTELRGILEDRRQSAAEKYRQLCIGRPGLWPLIRYELITGLLGSLPGALGLFLRQKFYPLLLGRCGRSVVFGRNITLRHPHRIRIGDRAVVDDHVVLDGKGDRPTTIDIADDCIIGRNTVLSCKGGTITLGPRTNISVNCTLISESQLTIGARVLIAGHCYIIGGGNHGLDRIDIAPLDQPRMERGGVTIADNCWLGASVTVLDGITLGRDAVIGAGAVVTRPLPAFAVAAGIPARTLYTRSDKQSSSAPSGEAPRP